MTDIVKANKISFYSFVRSQCAPFMSRVARKDYERILPPGMILTSLIEACCTSKCSCCKRFQRQILTNEGGRGQANGTLNVLYRERTLGQHLLRMRLGWSVHSHGYFHSHQSSDFGVRRWHVTLANISTLSAHDCNPDGNS